MAKEVKAAEVKPVKIVITANHIYLPLDADGNCLVWEGIEETPRVERRTRLLTHPDMAASLAAGS